MRDPVSTARRRLCSQFVRCVAALADRLGEAGQWELAESLCRQAVEVEPLEEGLYRTWRRSLIAQGHAAEAEAVYRGCEQRQWAGANRKAIGKIPCPTLKLPKRVSASVPGIGGVEN
jgi:DNA-binding SARP family transcriptional activator